MGKSSSINRPVIANRRLEWVGGVKSCNLIDENGLTLYKVRRLYDKETGRPLRDSTGAGYHYEVSHAGSKNVLGVKAFYSEAKYLAERDFGKRHHGMITGFWTSQPKTRALGKKVKLLQAMDSIKMSVGLKGGKFEAEVSDREPSVQSVVDGLNVLEVRVLVQDIAEATKNLPVRAIFDIRYFELPDWMKEEGVPNVRVNMDVDGALEQLDRLVDATLTGPWLSLVTRIELT